MDEQAAPRSRPPRGDTATAPGVNPRLLLLAGAAVIGVIVLIALALTVFRRDSQTTEDDVAETVKTSYLVVSEQARIDGEPFNLNEFRRLIDEGTEGFVVRMSSDQSGDNIGVAARQVDGPSCVLVWTAIGGPRSAVVDDPELPCSENVAFAAATASSS